MSLATWSRRLNEWPDGTIWNTSSTSYRTNLPNREYLFVFSLSSILCSSTSHSSWLCLRLSRANLNESSAFLPKPHGMAIIGSKVECLAIGESQSGNLTLSIAAVSVSQPFQAFSYLRVSLPCPAKVSLSGEIWKGWVEWREGHEVQSWTSPEVKQRKTITYASDWVSVP